MWSIPAARAFPWETVCVPLGSSDLKRIFTRCERHIVVTPIHDSASWVYVLRKGGLLLDVRSSMLIVANGVCQFGLTVGKEGSEFFLNAAGCEIVGL